MDRFITVPAKDGSHASVLWEAREGSVPNPVARSADPEALEGWGSVPLHRSSVPTTMEARSPVNAAGFPVVDGDGRPLWEGARIAFTVPTHYRSGT